MRQPCTECKQWRQVESLAGGLCELCRSEMFAGRALPSEPTEALPGSEWKILVLMERARRGEALFHPDDRHIED